MDGSGTVVADNIFYTTSLLYTEGGGNFDRRMEATVTEETAVTENAMDFKFGALDVENPVKILNNVMFGYRFVDNTYSSLSDNGNAFVLHFGAGNIILEGNYIFDCKNGFAAGGPLGQDPAMYNIAIRNNLFYDMKENIDHIYGIRAENSYNGTRNVTIENNVFGKVGVNSLHAYNTETLSIRSNDFVDTKAMWFAPEFMDLRSKDLVIQDNIFYNTTPTGIPDFSVQSNNTHLPDPFDWTPFRNIIKTRIFTSQPTEITIR